MSPPSSPITGVVLAGGQARRMGRRDKGLIDLAGRPMIDYVIEALRPQVDELLINANRNLPLYRRYGYRVVPDRVTGYPGPLAGLAAGLAEARHELVLTVPCDGPWLPPDLAVRLQRHLDAEGADICVAHDGERLQPVHGLFRRRLGADLTAFLAADGRRIRQWLERHPWVAVDFSDQPDAFVNLNTPEERDRIEREIRRRAGR